MTQIEQPPDVLTDVSRDGGADAFRRVWRGYASVVSLIATEEGGTRYAMLATAVTSVSMDPPSLLIWNCHVNTGPLAALDIFRSCYA